MVTLYLDIHSPDLWYVCHESQGCLSPLINDLRRSYSSRNHEEMARGKHLEMDSHLVIAADDGGPLNLAGA